MRNEFFPHIYILIRSWNAFEYLEHCIISALQQEYPHFTILFVDDASPYSKKQISSIRQLLKGHISIFNTEHKYSVQNAYQLLHTYADKKNAIVFNLDGDDHLLSNRALYEVAKVYKRDKCSLTYGECVVNSAWFGLSRFLPSRYVLKGHNIPYPEHIIKNKLYRKHYFIPLHPRTWSLDLFKKIQEKDFKDNQNKWFRTCEDQAIFYPLLEMTNGNFTCMKNVSYYYRLQHENSDSALHRRLQLQEENIIRNKKVHDTLREFKIE